MANWITEDRIGKAAHEIGTVNMQGIEQNTAITWGARAIASYNAAKQAGRNQKGVQLLINAALYKHEACEHAAQVSAAFLAQICEELSQIPG